MDDGPTLIRRAKSSKLRRVCRHFASPDAWHSQKKPLARSKWLILKPMAKAKPDAALAIQMPKLYVPRKPRGRRDR